jgi:very-short-patch-repair endonuclease
LGREGSDAERTKYLQANGWLVLRFWNTEVYEELEPVLETVYRTCEERRPQVPPSPPTPLPRSGGEGSRTPARR